MQSWGLTDIGRVRAQNQDAYEIAQLDRNSLIAVVCDGMGGAKSGNIASKLAIDVFVQEIRRVHRGNMAPEQVTQMLIGAVKLANYTVYEQAVRFPEFSGMGTTLVAAYVTGKWAAIVNVGDSRCYHITHSGISQITVDHSLVQVMVSRGELTAEQARSYPGKNYITRAVGTEPTVDCDIFTQHLERGDSLLLCSDGLHGVVDDQEILFEVVHGVNRDNCCQRLLDVANMRGAPDNVTSVLLLA